MNTRTEWTIESDSDGWFLEYWKPGEYWARSDRIRLKSTRFEDAIIEARIILNLD
jgi:hypothetical protein